ncbi:MAG: helix-turn-helix transcriptional regulator [Candidatus Woesearchaeota archaeon]|jgi:DNA-binding PadR family transcriptional regulator
MMRGHLRTIILTTLEDKDMSGSEIMGALEKNFGWKPSCGSVYPVLNLLEDEGYSCVKNNNDKSHKKIYSITTKGKIDLKNKKRGRMELADEMVKTQKVMTSIYNIEPKQMDDFMNKMKQGQMPFIQVHSEIEGIKKEMFRLLSKNLLSDNQEKVRSILNVAIADLKKINNKKSKNKIIKTKITKRKNA